VRKYVKKDFHFITPRNQREKYTVQSKGIGGC